MDTIDNPETVVQFAKRIVNIDEQMDALKEDRKEILAEAKASGIETKHLNKVVAERRKDRDSIEEEEEMLRLYRDAVRGKI